MPPKGKKASRPQVKKRRISASESVEQQQQHVKFILKSEPHEFSIADLGSKPNQTAPWDGIRNFEAAKMLKTEFQVGDRAYFYHSSCKDLGIVGEVKVTKDAYPDPEQFDSRRKYFDSKSTKEKPRWWCVDIQLLKTYPKIISLKDLKACPELRELQMLKRGRLSVSRVNESQYKAINQLISINEG